jgi:methylphosphotriester-DNA--protein-cysteine methyltransferase
MEAQFLLPPQRAAWSPAGMRHATRANGAEIVSLSGEARSHESGHAAQTPGVGARITFPRGARAGSDPEAIELLTRSSRSVLEVAVEVGFQSQSAFTQAFRRSTGQTPRGFRRELLRA